MLGIFRDEYDWYIAESAKAAEALREKMVGADDAANFGTMSLAADPLTLRDDSGAKATKAHAEWIAEAGGQPGYFASTEA